MSNEEMNRKMEFIVDQQAQFAADIQILKERQDRFQGQLEATNAHLEVLAAVANSSIEASTRTAEVVTKLAEAQAETQRQITRVARLLEAHVREGHPNNGAES